MQETYKFIKEKEKTLFKNLKERSFFFSGGVLYKKILQQDLQEFGISNVNAVSLLNGGLTLFGADEEVFEANMKHERNRKSCDIYRIREIAEAIAKELEYRNFDDVTDCSSSYVIDKFANSRYRTAEAHKSTDDGNHHYVISCFYEDGYHEFMYTDDLSVEQLTEKLEEFYEQESQF